MTIKDLKTNDIIIQRAGHVGMYIEKDGEGYIIYPTGGYDEVDSAYNDDLTDALNGEEFDIMQIYRYDHGFLCFSDYDDSNLIYARDQSWVRPK